jgi:hypothetical protein
MTSPSVGEDAKASSCSAIAALAADRRENKDTIALTEGALTALVKCASSGGDKTRANAALALANLVEDHVSNKNSIARLPGFLQALPALLRTGL